MVDYCRRYFGDQSGRSTGECGDADWEKVMGLQELQAFLLQSMRETAERLRREEAVRLEEAWRRQVRDQCCAVDGSILNLEYSLRSNGEARLPADDDLCLAVAIECLWGDLDALRPLNKREARAFRKAAAAAARYQAVPDDTPDDTPVVSGDSDVSGASDLSGALRLSWAEARDAAYRAMALAEKRCRLAMA